jgi:hypothetical protein
MVCPVDAVSLSNLPLAMPLFFSPAIVAAAPAAIRPDPEHMHHVTFISNSGANHEACGDSELFVDGEPLIWVRQPLSA